MSSWMFLVIATLSICDGIFIGGEQDIASPLRVAQCRATCLEKVGGEIGLFLRMCYYSFSQSG